MTCDAATLQSEACAARLNGLSSGALLQATLAALNGAAGNLTLQEITASRCAANLWAMSEKALLVAIVQRFCDLT